jgi:hypothetical protein
MSEPTNSHNNSAALVVAPPEVTAIERAGAPQELVRLAQINPDLAQEAMAIIMSRPVDQYNPPLQPARAVAAALHQRATGQVCGRDFFVDNRMGLVPGYRGRIREASDRGIDDYIDEYRPFTAQENEEHEIQRGDTAKVCELHIPSRAKLCRDMGIMYKPVIGFGIVRAREKKNGRGEPIELTGGYTWDRKARNRALKDALSHAGYAKTAREVIADAQARGVVIDHDEEFLGKLDRDQAAHVVKAAEEQAFHRAEAAAGQVLADAGIVSEQPISEYDGPLATEWQLLHAKRDDHAPSGATYQKTGACLNLLFGQDHATRTKFLVWAYGDNADADTLTAGQCESIREFIKPAQQADGSWVPADHALAFLNEFKDYLYGPDNDDLFGEAA